MKIKLRTRCGCERELDVPYPPNRYIILPLMSPATIVRDEVFLGDQVLATRKFEIQNFANRGPINSTAEYLETA